MSAQQHAAGVFGSPAGARQPWRAECSCGWVSVSYVREHAAQLMADDHLAREHPWTIEWDMGDYPGFTTQEDARAYQREHQMRGSSVTRV